MYKLLSAAERRGTPVLLSASVSDNSGNSPQVAAPRRPREKGQSRQRFHFGYDTRAIFVLTPNHTLPLGHLLSYLCICHRGMTYNYVDFKTRTLQTIMYLNNKCCVNAFIRSSNTK